MEPRDRPLVLSTCDRLLTADAVPTLAAREDLAVQHFETDETLHLRRVELSRNLVSLPLRPSRGSLLFLQFRLQQPRREFRLETVRAGGMVGGAINERVGGVVGGAVGSESNNHRVPKKK